MAECMDSEGLLQKMCEICKLKGAQSTATTFCVQCQDFMCSLCCVHHKLSKAMKHHIMLEEKEMPHRKASTSIPEYSEVHEGESLIFYCQNHYKLACYKCKDSQHQNCKGVVSLADIRKDIENSEMYRKIKMEIGRMVFLFRQQKSRILQIFQATSDSDDDLHKKEHTQCPAKLGVEMENLLNDKTEHTNEQKIKLIHTMKSCDDIIEQVGKLAGDLRLLEETHQQTQLFIAIKNYQQQMKQIKAVFGTIVGETERIQTPSKSTDCRVNINSKPHTVKPKTSAKSRNEKIICRDCFMISLLLFACWLTNP